jgi:outer membrane protein assembly factor BamB
MIRSDRQPGAATVALFLTLASLATLGAAVAAATPPDWARFRGPNGSGVSAATGVPTEFGPSKNLLWRAPLPQGHSSPILFEDRIYLTGLRERTLVTLAIDRSSGKVLWERGAPPVRTTVVDKRNNPASPSPAVERDAVYVFFPDYGLIAYNGAGKQRWALPLGPFTNIYGMVNEIGEDTYATPAFADGRIYVRTTAALYAFGRPQ